MFTLTDDYFKRKHSAEYFTLQQMYKQFKFLDLFPLHENKTKEFKTVYINPNAEDDIKNQIMSTPVPMTEASDFSFVDTSDLGHVTGTMGSMGLAADYTDDDVDQNLLTQKLGFQLTKIASNFAQTFDTYLGAALKESAQQANTQLSNWAFTSEDKKKNGDPVDDIVDLRREFKKGKYGHQITDIMISGERFDDLTKYVNSFIVTDNGPKRVARSDVELEKNALAGINFHDFGDDIGRNEFIAMDRSSQFAAQIEKKVNPRFSIFRQNEEKVTKGPSNKTNKMPKNRMQSLINVHKFDDNLKPDRHVIQFWCTMGLNVQDPYAFMKGTFKDTRT